jgi:hypothetical protein
VSGSSIDSPHFSLIQVDPIHDIHAALSAPETRRSFISPNGCIQRFAAGCKTGQLAFTACGDAVIFDPEDLVPWAPAVRFDGFDDGLFVEQHPVAGAKTFTIEAFFSYAMTTL